MALNLIMLGPPGAGKGTQAERFARSRGIPKISTGDILREAVHTGTEIGKRARAIMDRGELVSDEVMIGIVGERLGRADAQAGFILDGFPRTVAQAAALDGLMAGRDPLIVIDIVVPESELVRRLSTRMICANCGHNAPIADGSQTLCSLCGGQLVQRADDSQAVVLERLKIYRANTKPLVDFYQGRPTFRSINGAQGPDQVAAALASAIEAAGTGGSAPAGLDGRSIRGGR
jgi:adenylate kinase